MDNFLDTLPYEVQKEPIKLKAPNEKKELSNKQYSDFMGQFEKYYQQIS